MSTPALAPPAALKSTPILRFPRQAQSVDSINSYPAALPNPPAPSQIVDQGLIFESQMEDGKLGRYSGGHRSLPALWSVWVNPRE